MKSIKSTLKSGEFRIDLGLKLLTVILDGNGYVLYRIAPKVNNLADDRGPLENIISCPSLEREGFHGKIWLACRFLMTQHFPDCLMSSFLQIKSAISPGSKGR